MEITDQYIGRNANGERLYLDVRLVVVDGPERTIYHDTITEYRAFGASGHTTYRGRSVSAGQILDDLLDLRELAPGWTVAKVADLHATWKRWHLNQMQAGCAHQTVLWEDSEYGRRPSLEMTEPCPESGYRYGSAWLVDPMPGDVAGKIIHFINTGVWVLNSEGSN